MNYVPQEQRPPFGFVVTDDLNVRARFPIAVTTATELEVEAHLFLDVLGSPEAREILKAHGFTGVV